MWTWERSRLWVKAGQAGQAQPLPLRYWRKGGGRVRFSKSSGWKPSREKWAERAALEKAESWGRGGEGSGASRLVRDRLCNLQVRIGAFQRGGGGAFAGGEGRPATRNRDPGGGEERKGRAGTRNTGGGGEGGFEPGGCRSVTEDPNGKLQMGKLGARVARWSTGKG